MINNFILDHIKVLKSHKFAYPEMELRALLNNCSKSRKDIIFSNFNLNQIDHGLFNSSFKRRLDKEPIAKIFKKKGFWKYEFFVNNNVLDPRPETELIIEEIIKKYKNKNKFLKIADLGTGSGCLAISLAKEFKNSNILATDISSSAIEVAEINAKKFSVENRIQFERSNWIKSIQIFDIITSNPPYLSFNEYNNVSNDIKLYEPKIALVGGDDGLDCYRQIATKLKKITDNNSLCFFEIGINQKNECINIFKQNSINCLEIIKDYQNIERILVFKK
jgi:release factor glutamine methyltransferase